MNDSELLELAAKAAGLMGYRYCEAWSSMNRYTMQDGYFGPDWNPLTDDGDALRLAVKLMICFGPNFDEDTAVAFGRDGRNICEAYGIDPYAATRRAIVRAAAAMGAPK